MLIVGPFVGFIAAVTKGKSTRPPVVIVGAGPAGLACLSVLHHRGSHHPVVLVDARSVHIDQTRLHEAAQGNVEGIASDLQAIADRYGARYVRARMDLRMQALREAQRSASVMIEGQRVGFSQLVVATGSRPAPAAPHGARDIAALRCEPA